MIGRLTGTLAEKNPPQLLVDVNGVGYEVDVPMSTFYNLPGLGERVALLTHFVVREDAQVLYGFLTHEERSTFRQLVKISGVGPRTALLMLCYAAGASLPMLAIAYGGQFATTRVRQLARHAHRLQQGFGLVVAAFAVAMLAGVDTLATAWLTQHLPSLATGL